MFKDLKNNKRAKFILWDVETEGLNTCIKNRAWQLSYIICQGEQVLKEYDKFLWWPDLAMSEDAARITRFDYNNYKSKAEDPKIILDEFESYLYNPEYISIFHNGLGFDIYIHNIMRRELGRKTDYSYVNRSIDTVSLSKMYKLGIKTIQTENFTEEMFKFNNFVQKGLKSSLSIMAKEFGLEFSEANLHDGIVDCRLNFQLWNKLKFCFDWN
jgi:DNA polymerase III epsilon subunit-like protein